MTVPTLPSIRYLSAVAPPPLCEVSLVPGEPGIFCKLEFLNPSGSTKDRVARYVLEKAWRLGRIGPGSAVVEASSGSTSIALALVTSQMGLRFIAVMPVGVSPERKAIIEAFGGEVRFVPKALGMGGAIAESERISRQEGAFATRQFENPDNSEAHRVWTGQEILAQIPGGTVDAVVSGVGTGGTIVGLYQAFAQAGCPVEAIAARPVQGGSDLECCSFSTRVPGVVEGISKLYTHAALPRLREFEIPDDEVLDTARSLQRMGFPVGPSSGLNLAAARRVLRERPNARVVTVFPDRMERYFSTELFGSRGA
jgi:cysteine synthase A